MPNDQVTPTRQLAITYTAVDWLNRGTVERFSVVYILYSMKEHAYFRVRAWVPEDDATLDTVSHLWKSANWGGGVLF